MSESNFSSSSRFGGYRQSADGFRPSGDSCQSGGSYRQSGGSYRQSGAISQKPTWTPPPPEKIVIQHQKVHFSAKKEDAFFVGKYIPDKYVPSPTEFLRSGYTRPHANCLPEDAEVYVLGIMYKAGDSQCSVTGTAEWNGNKFEDPATAAIREAQEEIGLTCDLHAIRGSQSVQIGKKTWHTFVVPVTDMRPIAPDDVIVLPLASSFKDGKRPWSETKVQLYIYGTRDELLSALDQTTLRTCEEVDIAGVVLLRTDQIRECFPYQ
jgi:hypothetical protein